MDILDSISSCVALLAFIGTYCLILYHDRAGMPDRVKARGVTAVGTVVELRPHPAPAAGAAGGEGCAPVVAFETPWGSHRHVSTTYQQPCPFQVGQAVNLRYHFRKSIREVLLDAEAPPAPPRALRAWGLGLCLVGYPFVLFKLRLLL